MKRQSKRIFSEEEKREIIEESLKGERTRTAIWRHYTGQKEEHGEILRWMRQLGLIKKLLPSKPLILKMHTKKSKGSEDELKKHIRQLEAQLEDSQLTAEAYRRMIQLAEEQLKINIRKKSSAK